MHKAMFVCSTCGFVAFVAGRLELEVTGWLVEDGPHRTTTISCPACRADRTGHGADAPKIRTAGDSSR